MNCLEFRRRCGAEPGRPAAEIEEHVRECSGCAAFAAELRALDGLILEALRIDARDEERKMPAAREPRPAAMRRRGGPAWLGVAATFLLGLALAAGIWLSVPRVTLAGEVVAHVLYEPQALAGSAVAVAGDVLRDVLSIANATLRDEAGLVTYATACPFRGHTVPHLVVQAERGPVTVLVLRHEKISSPMPIDEEGFRGTIVPSGQGSIAILGREPVDVDLVRSRVLEALKWM